MKRQTKFAKIQGWRKIADSIKLNPIEKYALTAVFQDWPLMRERNPSAFIVLVNRTLGKNYPLTI